MKNIELYLTDWMPNGTNDLLIVDKSTNEIIEFVESAAFGVDVCKPNSKPRTLLVADMDNAVYRVRVTEYDPSIHTVVKRVTRTILKKHFCVSPIDPDGSDLDKRLKLAGINLSKGK